jgi:hypothetical protein
MALIIATDNKRVGVNLGCCGRICFGTLEGVAADRNTSTTQLFLE